MSGTYHTLLVIAYVLPLAMIGLLYAARASRRHRLIMALLGALPIFYISHYLLFKQLEGWPSDAPLPDRFQLLAYQIAEPDPQHDRRGEILMWITSDPASQPRAHRLAYSKALHQALVMPAEDRQERACRLRWLLSKTIKR